MRKTRPPAVAGMFYPAEPDLLRRQVDECLASAQPRDPGGRRVKAVIAPHAGYVYSGPIAGSAFVQLAADAGEVRRIVLLGPAHRVPLRGLGLPGCDAFSTPLGEVPVAAEAVAAVAGLGPVAETPAAHAPEHSLEVELPFLQALLGEFELLPLVVGDARGDEVAEVLEQVWGAPRRGSSSAPTCRTTCPMPRRRPWTGRRRARSWRSRRRSIAAAHAAGCRSTGCSWPAAGAA